MSYHTWHIYGYGIKVSDIEIGTVDRLKELLKLAPAYEKKVKEWLWVNDIREPAIEDILEYDRDFMLGLDTILKEVIQEAEGIEFTACNDFDDERYLVYEPDYPWYLTNRSGEEKELTEEKIKEMIEKYVSILTDEDVKVDYQSVENGG